MARAFVELADTLVADFDVTDFLHILTDVSVQVLGADAVLGEADAVELLSASGGRDGRRSRSLCDRPPGAIFEL
ncbi:MAG: hypothetical protein WKF57_03170 [Nakamurella sp.]